MLVKSHRDAQLYKNKAKIKKGSEMNPTELTNGVVGIDSG